MVYDLLVNNQENRMKKILAIALCSLPLSIAPVAYAQSTAPEGGAAQEAPAPAPAPAPGAGAGGGAMPGADAPPPKEEEVVEAISGWSVKDKIIGNTVYNEGDEKIGSISDVVLASDGKAAYFIVGAGGFLGLGERNVAIPFEEITQNGDKLILAGYTKDQLKALPKVEVTQ